MFERKLMKLMLASLDNFYPDNYDWKIRKLGWQRRALLLLESTLNGLMHLLGRKVSVLFNFKNNFYLQHIEQFRSTFDLLDDEVSKSKYIELLAYKALGFTKVKLSLNNDQFWEARAKIASYKLDEKIDINFRDGYLNLFDLSGAGYDLKLYFVENGVLVDFILQQYNYQDIVCVRQGDVVVDAGGCWGDTALYFAAKGARQVFVYEFIPSNIEILKKNLLLNGYYAENITLVDNAVWESSDLALSFDDRGPSSRVAHAGCYAGEIRTLSIDDLVTRQNLAKVDFIKMDIEGAEIPALEGAAETIRKFKPKLAISAYHKPDDLIKIPELLHALNPDYLFYLDYYTIIGDEIILYAIDKHHV